MWSGRVYKLDEAGQPELETDIIINQTAEEIQGACGESSMSGAWVNRYLDAGLLDLLGGMSRVPDDQCYPYRWHETGEVLNYGVNLFKRPAPFEMIHQDNVWLTEWINEPTGPQLSWRVVPRVDLGIGPSWDPDAFEGAAAIGAEGFKVDQNMLIALGISIGLYFLFSKMEK